MPPSSPSESYTSSGAAHGEAGTHKSGGHQGSPETRRQLRKLPTRAGCRLPDRRTAVMQPIQQRNGKSRKVKTVRAQNTSTRHGKALAAGMAGAEVCINSAETSTKKNAPGSTECIK